MKTLTISVADDVYQRASQKAAAAEISLPEVVQDLLSEWTQQDHRSVGATTESQRRADFLKFLDELAARPLKPGPSVGPLNREELYQRGVSGY
jgi:predicted CopG family antitoxin